MAATVGPVHHGGDGGAPPPPDPSRPFGHQDDTVPPTRRPTRSKNRGLSLHTQVQKNGGPLPITFDGQGDTWNPVGTHANHFSRYVGILVRQHCDPACNSWARVPQEQKMQVTLGLREVFLFPDALPDATATTRSTVPLAIDRTAQDRYKDWKSTLNRHFLAHGGDEEERDLQQARQAVPPDVSADVWERCCALFDTADFRVQFYGFYNVNV